jgi:hypothetical protein
MPGRARPPHHQQRFAAFGLGAGAMEDIKTEAVDPESLCPLQVA